MRLDNKWQDLLQDDQHLIKLLFADEPVPQYPGDELSQNGRLYQTLDVVWRLMRGEFTEAGSMIEKISQGQTFYCHQLAVIWLKAEMEDPALAYAELLDWMKNSGLTSLPGRLGKVASRFQIQELDKRLATRWLPVLRLYLASLQDEWTPQMLLFAEQDKEAALENQVSSMIIRRLDTMLKMAVARKQGAVTEVLQIAADWQILCQQNNDYGHGAEFMLDAVLALEAEDRLEDALLWLDQTLLLLPNSYEPLLLKARILKLCGELDQSLAVSNQLIEHFPTDFSGYCLRSNSWFLAGEMDKAMADACKACELAPDNPNSLTARAYVTMQLGDFATALQDFRHSLEQDPHSYDARRGEGKCLSMLGRDFEALACFNSLRRSYPDDPDLCYEIADVLFSAGYLKECEKICQQGLKLDDSYANLYVILGMIATRRAEDDLARGLLLHAIELEPDNPFALNELAYLCYLDGDDEKAIELIEDALAESEDYADAWCNKGMILYYQSEFEQAQRAFQKALQLAPDHVTAWVGRGNALVQQCEYEAGLICYDRALQIDPQSADACHGKALLYRIMGLEEEVRIWQEKAVRLDPEIDDL